ncbi:MAG: FAD-dependent oxidoreductase, partial [Alphaproteobacteria bacterium]|nr:FAD-dependent oxidoreductase [Alphaproteobacteria bacterium]
LGMGDAPHDGASGNIAAVQSPRLTAEDTFPGRLSLTAYGYARWLARECQAVLSDQAVITAFSDREAKRQSKITALGWPQEVFRYGSSDDVAEAVGLSSSQDGLIFPEGGSIDPRTLCRNLLAGATMRFGVEVTAITKGGDGWILTTNQGEIPARRLVLAAGSGLAKLTQDWLDPLLPFQVTAGRVSHLPSSAFPQLKAAVSFGGYMARASDGQLALGASFDRNLPQGVVPPMDEPAHHANKALLPEEWQDAAGDVSGWQGRVSFRLASADRQPVAGQVDDDLYVLAALGARGMVTGPLLGEHVATVMTGAPSPLDRGMASVVDPFRFSARAGF